MSSRIPGLRPVLTPNGGTEFTRMRSFSSSWAEYRIRVHSFHPFGVNTGLKPGMRELIEETPELMPFYLGSLPDQVSEAEDIAAAVAWLASSEARHVTGIQLPVDLGRTNR